MLQEFLRQRLGWITAAGAAHSVVEFKVRHMMISFVKGKFSGLSGVLKLDEIDYTRSFVEVSIPAASVCTVDEKLDAHLKEADFFDVVKFPTLSFKSTTSDQRAIVTTWLTAI